ncbi:MAG TPA: aldehyde:ferredoxin oxidoreductase [Clostridiales bacterium UBA8960]|nr:aldehyde:ferredoxin oxidoreductase [Clostridiales bacterium UBA8960]
MFGYNGKMAQIDLSSAGISDYPVSEEHYEAFMGGKTLAAKIIFDAFDHKVEAFSNENIIVITTSPFTGSTAPCSSRFNISTFSPLTGLLISSNCGGSFGLHLKKSGYDGLIISGKSPEPVYIDIDNETICIKSAKHLWGMNTSEVQDNLGAKNRGKLVIGIAGENLVRYAAVISEERAAGRGGVGAVFGYKNLKGIVASGQKSIDIFDKEGFKSQNIKWINQLKEHPLTGKQLPKFGTAGLVSLMHYRNLLATKNYSSGQFEAFEAISGEKMTEEKLVKNKGCVTCPIQCGRQVTAYGKTVKGPELETLGLLGSNLLNSDLDSIIRLNHLCDEYGLDTITFGSTIGFAMELCEKGIWDNGLKFGEVSTLEALIEDISRREGIGAELAEGTRRLSEKYGGMDFAIHVKGLEAAAYEPRAAQGMGLGYATSNRGGCHLNGGYMVVLEGLGLNVNGKTTKGKAAYTIMFQDMMEAVSSAGSCLFTTYAMLPPFLLNKPNRFYVRLINGIIPLAGGLVGVLKKNTWLMRFNMSSLLPHPHFIKLITGNKMTIGHFLDTGERGYNLERFINIRQGLKGTDDTLPKRLLKELQRSDDPDSIVKLDEMLGTYYKLRGWDKDGIPTQWTLKRLKIMKD